MSANKYNYYRLYGDENNELIDAMSNENELIKLFQEMAFGELIRSFEDYSINLLENCRKKDENNENNKLLSYLLILELTQLGFIFPFEIDSIEEDINNLDDTINIIIKNLSIKAFKIDQTYKRSLSILGRGTISQMTGYRFHGKNDNDVKIIIYKGNSCDAQESANITKGDTTLPIHLEIKIEKIFTPEFKQKIKEKIEKMVDSIRYICVTYSNKIEAENILKNPEGK